MESTGEMKTLKSLFAAMVVVASEISRLATQTQEATEDIYKMVGNISQELDRVVGVVGVVGEMIQNSENQNEKAVTVADNFSEIRTTSDMIYMEAGILRRMVDELTESNQVIVDGIGMISAAAKEVSETSAESLAVSSENAELLSSVSDRIQTIGTFKEESDSENMGNEV